MRLIWKLSARTVSDSPGTGAGMAEQHSSVHRLEKQLQYSWVNTLG